jgi:hypothetical protein
MLQVTVPSFLFQIRIAAAGQVASHRHGYACTSWIHCFPEPFFHQGLNIGRQISHLLVAPFFGGLLCITGLMNSRGHGIDHPVVPATFRGVVSGMGAALSLAVLAELCALALLWDLFTEIPRGLEVLLAIAEVDASIAFALRPASCHSSMM